MKIVKCSKCGKYIHKTTECFYCGNTTNFHEEYTPHIHENVIEEFSKVESLIESKRFDEALLFSHTVIEWMPNFSGIFWLRLLAKNKCTSAADLIQKGFDVENDADFYNALVFSKGPEHSAYIDIQNTMIAAKKAIKEEIANHEYKCKIKTNILEIKKTMQSEIDSRKKKLFSLWLNLESTEDALYNLELDCRLLSKEYIDSLDKAALNASSIKEKAYRMEECTEEDLHRYQIMLGNILQQSEEAKEILEKMKTQHPWVNSFNGLVKKRNEQVCLINTEIASLKSYEKTIQQTLDKIEQIEERHRKAIRAAEIYNFLDSANLLGKDCYNRILHNIGLGIHVQRSVSIQDWQPKDESSITAVNNGDDADKNNYFDSWGLPNDSY